MSRIDWKALSLQSWGRTRKADMLAVRPERLSEAVSIIRDKYDTGLTIYGAGRSYGDAPLNHDGRVILTERLKSFP